MEKDLISGRDQDLMRASAAPYRPGAYGRVVFFRSGYLFVDSKRNLNPATAVLGVAAVEVVARENHRGVAAQSGWEAPVRRVGELAVVPLGDDIHHLLAHFPRESAL